MNPINKALSELKFRIPKPILERAFVPPRTFGGMRQRSPVSLDYRIREAVIDARVMVDCDLVGGTETTIPLASVPADYLADYKVVWSIPFTLTQNRKISRVYSLVYGDGGVPTNATPYGQGGSQLADAARGLMSSHAPIPNVSNAEIQLVGENTIMAHQHIPLSPQLHLRCVLENDSEFNHLPPTSVHHFCKLVEFATKSYVYNELIVELDRGEIAGGADLGRFSSLVEDYADAEELYQEYFSEAWRKVAIFSDDEARKRHLKMAVGGLH